MTERVSIYTTHYQNDKTINSSVIFPIHVGHVGSIDKSAHYDINDSMGDNISSRNSSFCELTAHYSIWKNRLDSEYIGFMHHRRHLNFNYNKVYQVNSWGLIEYAEIDDNYISECGLTEDGIKKALTGYDVLVAEKWDVRQAGCKNNYDLYGNSEFLHIEDYDAALDILSNRHPEYKYYIDQYNKDYLGFYTNIFVMKKDIFEEYCAWIFPILFELEDSIDISSYNSTEKRVFGHVAERLFGIYLYKLKGEGKYNIKELQRTIVLDTTPKCKSMTESFSSIKMKASKCEGLNYVPIVVNFNDNYSHVAGACLLSVIDNSTDTNFYEIFILGNKVSEKNQVRYQNMILGKNNFNIKYVEISKAVNLDGIYNNYYFSLETYFRLFIPKIFSDFKKVIYIDVDMIVRNDISNLMDFDLSGRALAGVQCYVMQSFIANNVLSHVDTGSIEAKEYCNSYLRLTDSSKYIQAGVLVFNIKELNEISFTERVIEELDQPHWFLDQDIINKIVDGNITLLPYDWNVLHGNDNLGIMVESLPLEIKEQYLHARINPSIVHFAGPEKPWINRNVEFSDEYWKYSMKTIWFSDIVFDTYNNFVTSNVKHKKIDTLLFKTKIKVRNLFEILCPRGTSRRTKVIKFYLTLKRNIK